MSKVPLYWMMGRFFFFFTLVTGPRRSLSLKFSDRKVYEDDGTGPDPVRLDVALTLAVDHPPPHNCVPLRL